MKPNVPWDLPNSINNMIWQRQFFSIPHISPSSSTSFSPGITTLHIQLPPCVTNCNHSMEKISAACYEASSRLVELPTELTIEINSRVAAQSEDAIVDLHNLRTTCKAMCVVGGATMVG
jgi:hypothetical protein